MTPNANGSLHGILVERKAARNLVKSEESMAQLIALHCVSGLPCWLNGKEPT